MNEREKIIDTIKKCLALGDASRNPEQHEAESAIRRARSLMDRYNLSMADIAASEGADQARMGEAATTPWSGMPQWSKDLCKVSDALFATYHFQRSVGKPAKDQIVFCGDELGVAMAVEVFKLLRLELYALAGSWERNQNPEELIDIGTGWTARAVPFRDLSSGQKRTRKFKYMEGVAWTLYARARKMSEDLSAADAAKVNALVVRKSDEARTWAQAKYNLVSSTRRTSGLHADAVRTGLKDGNKISLDFKNKVKPTSSRAALQIGDGK